MVMTNKETQNLKEDYRKAEEDRPYWLTVDGKSVKDVPEPAIATVQADNGLGNLVTPELAKVRRERIFKNKRESIKARRDEAIQKAKWSSGTVDQSAMNEAQTQMYESMRKLYKDYNDLKIRIEGEAGKEGLKKTLITNDPLAVNDALYSNIEFSEAVGVKSFQELSNSQIDEIETRLENEKSDPTWMVNRDNISNVYYNAIDNKGNSRVADIRTLAAATGALNGMTKKEVELATSSFKLYDMQRVQNEKFKSLTLENATEEELRQQLLARSQNDTEQSNLKTNALPETIENTKVMNTINQEIAYQKQLEQQAKTRETEYKYDQADEVLELDKTKKETDVKKAETDMSKTISETDKIITEIANLKKKGATVEADKLKEDLYKKNGITPGMSQKQISDTLNIGALNEEGFLQQDPAITMQDNVMNGRVRALAESSKFSPPQIKAIGRLEKVYGIIDLAAKVGAGDTGLIDSYTNAIKNYTEPGADGEKYKNALASIVQGEFQFNFGGALTPGEMNRGLEIFGNKKEGLIANLTKYATILRSMKGAIGNLKNNHAFHGKYGTMFRKLETVLRGVDVRIAAFKYAQKNPKASIEEVTEAAEKAVPKDYNEFLTSDQIKLQKALIKALPTASKQVK